MNIPPDYQITSEMLDLIAKINANLIFFSTFKVSEVVKEKMQRISILKSSLFSARIEGNPLTIENFGKERDDDIKKIEVFNISKAADFINKNIALETKILKKVISELHSMVMKSLSFDAGKFRTEVSAIFNIAGVAVYMPPPPDKIQVLIDEMLKYANSGTEKFPLINAFVSHLIFEKMHPFLDGNGRVGRLLVSGILKSKDKNYNYHISFEEYLDERKEDYYCHLDNGLSKTNDYLLFMLDAFYNQTERLKESIEKENQKKETLLLPPRQEEIYNIIKDHNIVSFDQIHRRFLKVPSRTLRYDLKKLLDKDLVLKIGKTRGSYYRVK
ncbi:MAG: Fic family protein [Candidatus Levybacteria bacterium]|nr:Fic family protein [Candidatus Levybacteria bacterium]